MDISHVIAMTILGNCGHHSHSTCGCAQDTHHECTSGRVQVHLAVLASHSKDRTFLVLQGCNSMMGSYK